MSYMFSGLDLKEFPDISRWDVSKVTSMESLFSSNFYLLYLPDISNWNTGSLK